MRSIGEIIVRSLGQGAMINRTIGHGEDAQPAPLPKAHFRTTNEMLDELAFWEKTWHARLLLKTPMRLAETFELVRSGQGRPYTPFIDKAEETVAELSL